MSSVRTPPRRRVHALTVLGLALLLAGLGCLGWVGYQYFGTDIVSKQAFDGERQQLRSSWDSARQRPPSRQQSGGKAQLEPVPLAGGAVALLRIPAFGAGYEIPILDGTDLGVLAKGVGHYTKTAGPGEIGNFALAGHRVTHGEPFAHLLDLKKGDQVIVETQQAVYTYVLDSAPRQLTVRDTDTWVLDPVPGKTDVEPSEALITLTTCQDLFHSPDRSIGFGHLESTQNK